MPMNLQNMLYPLETRVSELLLEYGPCPVYRTEAGRKLTLLPTRTVPETHLIEENWNPKQVSQDEGNFRKVRWIYQLVNGDKVSLYIKGPELIFTADQRRLEKGEIWWGGPRSGERYIRIREPVVEDQVEWESIFLLELHRHGIRAEVPQALVEDTYGKKELIVHGVDTNYDKKCEPNQPSYDELFDIIRKEIGLVPEDEGGHNLLYDKDGYLTIIDVNRWEWPPYTNDFRKRLLEAIQKRVQQKS